MHGLDSDGGQRLEIVMMISRRRQAWLPTFVASVVFALSFSFYLSSLAVLPTLAQEAPAPTKMLQGNVTNSVPATGLSRDDLDTQRKIDTEDDQHDTNDAAIDNATREGGECRARLPLEGDRAIAGAGRGQAGGDRRRERTAPGRPVHFQRQQAEEDKRHAERLAWIEGGGRQIVVRGGQRRRQLPEH